MKMKLQNFNLKNFRSKEWWISELKQINWTEVLLLIALILCYFQVVHIKEVAQDPCSFCLVNSPYEEPITCKEYFYRDFDGYFNNQLNFGGGINVMPIDLFINETSGKV